MIEISYTGARTLHLFFWITECSDKIVPEGTSVLVKPGVIAGGSITHDCPLSRSVGYFLEPLIMIAPFAKKPLNLTLRGITTDDRDLSVDLIRTVTLPHLQLFGIEEGLELRVSVPHLASRDHV